MHLQVSGTQQVLNSSQSSTEVDLHAEQQALSLYCAKQT